jgi:hypothetical protein
MANCWLAAGGPEGAQTLYSCQHIVDILHITANLHSLPVYERWLHLPVKGIVSPINVIVVCQHIVHIVEHITSLA